MWPDPSYKAPWTKGRGFNPSPIPTKGIPKFADSVRNKKVIGTPDHQKWWEEQIYYIHNGFSTGGVDIPGFIYYYLNFRKIPTEYGPIYPWFHDLHLELYHFVKYIEDTHQNALYPKGRRGGISEFFCAYLDYKYRFNPNSYKAGVAAGNDDYIQDFMAKFRYGDSLIAPELRINMLTNNDKEIIAGYEIKEDGSFIEAGSRNTIYTRTAGMNPNLFKGLLLNDVFIEELGEFENVMRFIAATEDCLKRGSVQFGCMHAWGCVCAGTKVWDNNGVLINIEDLKPENGIIGYDKNKETFSKEDITYWQPPKEKDCYRITTSLGRILECSDDHPIYCSIGMVFRGAKKHFDRKKVFNWVEAKDLIPGKHQAAVLDELPIFTGTEKMWHPRLVGWLIGDGSYGFDKTPIMSNCDYEINNYIEELFDTTTERSHITKLGKIYKEIRIRNICPELRKLGIYGQTKDNKRLPIDLDKYCKSDIYEVIGGLFDTDGCVHFGKKNYHRIDLSSSGIELLKQVQFYLQKLGIHAVVTKIKARKTERNKNPYYRLTVADRRSVVIFCKNIQFKLGYKQDKLNNIYKEYIDLKTPVISFNGLRSDLIKSVEYIGKKPVYNLTAGITNTYVCNGIVTHNTGGKDTTAFRELYYKGKDYNFVPFFIKGTKFYFPFFGRIAGDGKKAQEIPNLIKTLKNHQAIGMDDEIAAEDFIKKELERLAKGDRKKYLEYKQNRPLKIQDVLTTTTVNDFDTEKLNAQADAIAALEHPKYSKYKLEWKKDENSMPVIPRQVNLIPLKTGEDESECVYILDEVIPLLSKIKQYLNFFCAGIDSYDQDTSRTSKSLGAMCVLIRENGTFPTMSKIPVACIRTRPSRKEKFYELCAKTSVLFDLLGNTLIDVRTPGIIQYYKNIGLEKYLAMRPPKFESPNSQQGHDFGVSLNDYSRLLMVGLMQTYIYDHSTGIWFNSNEETGPNMISELQMFDEETKDSDNDLADGLGITLMQDVSVGVAPVDKSKNIITDRFDLPEYGYDNNGDVVPIDMGGRVLVEDGNKNKGKGDDYSDEYLFERNYENE